MKRVLAALGIFVGQLAAIGPSPASAEVRYTVIDLGTLGGTLSVARGLNDAEPVQVTGFSTTSEPTKTRAFVWRQGTMTNIGVPDGCTGSSSGHEINTAGRVAGECSGGFLWKPAANGNPASFTRVTDPPNSDSTELSRVNAVNNSDQIVGTKSVVREDTQKKRHAFKWDGPLTPVDLHGSSVLDGFDLSTAQDVNANGTVAGSAFYSSSSSGRAVRWASGGVPTILDTCAPNLTTCGSEAFGINDNDVVVGTWSVAGDEIDGDRATRWTAADQRLNLGVLAAPYNVHSTARAINNDGQIVGSSSSGDTSEAHAFLWENNQMLDLNDLIAPGSGWVLKNASDINEDGEIVGHGSFQGDPNRAFLLTFGGQSTELFDTFALDAPPVTEGGGGGAATLAAGGPKPKPTAKFVVKRATAGKTSSVRFATQNDTAKAGQDYVAKSGKVTFTGNQKSKTVKVTILNDNKNEQNEKFFLVLSNPSDNTKITDRKAKATIRDDD